MLYQIKAKHFCAGLAFNIPWAPTTVGDAAPILRYMVGWTLNEVKAYCKRKKWELRKVKSCTIST